MADFLTGEYIFGEIVEIAEGSWLNDKTGKNDPYKNLFMLVPQADRTVTKEKIKLPVTFNNGSVVIGKFYGVPVTTKPPFARRDKNGNSVASSNVLSRTLREGAPVMPAPPLNNKAAA